MTGSAHAGPTRYVTDQLTITLRSGAGNEYRILKLLPTGTAVEVLEKGNGWTRVDAGDGRQGWVPSQYLISQPPAAQRLQQISAELAQLQAQNGQIRQQMQGTQQQLAQARERIQQLSSERDRLIQQLDESQVGFNLATENKQLKKQIIDFQRRLQNLADEAERFADRSRQDWFLVGAGVLLAGMLVGIIMTRIRWRRRSAWGEL
ncbi:MAG TPA: TIGR04211 family SH3 domain-containing protein [Nitrococcus sp.]|nr:TIGR04211 family SH3 domain-containing protein [Nitrococcus sp.]